MLSLSQNDDLHTSRTMTMMNSTKKKQPQQHRRCRDMTNLQWQQKTGVLVLCLHDDEHTHKTQHKQQQQLHIYFTMLTVQKKSSFDWTTDCSANRDASCEAPSILCSWIKWHACRNTCTKSLRIADWIDTEDPVHIDNADESLVLHLVDLSSATIEYSTTASDRTIAAEKSTNNNE